MAELITFAFDDWVGDLQQLDLVLANQKVNVAWNTTMWLLNGISFKHMPHIVFPLTSLNCQNRTNTNKAVWISITGWQFSTKFDSWRISYFSGCVIAIIEIGVPELGWTISSVQITELEEYYPYKTELKLLTEHAKDIIKTIPKGSKIVELGCGSASKTSILQRELLKRYRWIFLWLTDPGVLCTCHIYTPVLVDLFRQAT